MKTHDLKCTTRPISSSSAWSGSAGNEPANAPSWWIVRRPGIRKRGRYLGAFQMRSLGKSQHVELYRIGFSTGLKKIADRLENVVLASSLTWATYGWLTSSTILISWQVLDVRFSDVSTANLAFQVSRTSAREELQDTHQHLIADLEKKREKEEKNIIVDLTDSRFKTLSKNEFLSIFYQI